MYLQQGLRRSSTRQIGSMSEATRGILQKSATRKCLGGAHSRTHIPPLAAHNHGQGHHTHASRNRFLSPPGLLSLGSGGRGEDGLTTANVLSPRLLAGLRGGMSMVVDRPCLRTSTRVPAGRRTSWRLEGRPASSAAFLRRNRPSRRLIASLACPGKRNGLLLVRKGWATSQYFNSGCMQNLPPSHLACALAAEPGLKNLGYKHIGLPLKF